MKKEKTALSGCSSENTKITSLPKTIEPVVNIPSKPIEETGKTESPEIQTEPLVQVTIQEAKPELIIETVSISTQETTKTKKTSLVFQKDSC